ncbi:MAG: hypothetical protein OEO19_14585 [Gammaproteobacteria bacterium]|nr:hypothetical protein [Gammaproteobacteria bacterium]MDH3446769.1 hypothetical protein [Gammaproteobacteria bacterium]
MSDLLKTLLLIVCFLTCGTVKSAPSWIEHASKPGPDIAPGGQSLFDQLFLQADGGYRIPYPFDELIEALDARIDNEDEPAVLQVFVPIGRSLQREAPAPDYFQFPRRLIALDGEPVTRDNEAGLALRYRLFIAHQPKTRTLEVISYNDGAGRFEFQVVENYAADTEPRVAPANRVMCMSCHQNAAPIFAAIPWSETSFNVAVASRLVETLPDRFNSLVGTVTADAGVIDVLVERANYLSAAQLIWRRGCTTRRCRAAILRAILQYRLSGESNFAEAATGYQRDYLGELTRNWSRFWPRGLALPGSRIADRDPFASAAMTIEQDPLFARPPHATWYQVDATLARGIVYRLAGFFTLADIRRIDRHLTRLGDANPSAGYRYRASCHAVQADARSLVLSCGDHSRAQSLQATLELELRGDQVDSIRITSLRVPRDTNLLQPDVASVTLRNGRLELKPANNEAGLSQRLANGDRIGAMVLSWKDTLRESQSSLEIEVAAEFEHIDRALQQLLDEDGQRQGDGLAANVFERSKILQKLMQRLDMYPLAWTETMAPAVAVNTQPERKLDGKLALLVPYCAHCHRDDRDNPPGFLAGDNPQAAVLQCAPRILRRLKAWQAGFAIAKSPMPPAASLEFSGISADDWPASDHYRGLVAGLEELALERRGGQALRTWLEADYRLLPPCLAAISE